MATKRSLDITTAKVLALTPKPGDKILELARAVWQLLRDHPEKASAVLKAAKVSRRRAFYLAEVGQKFAPFMQYEKRLIAIGWTKLSKLADLVTPENIEELLLLAESKSVQALSNLTRGRDVSLNLRTVTLHLTPQQYRKYANAIVKNGGLKRGKQLLDQEVALMKILSGSVEESHSR